MPVENEHRSGGRAVPPEFQAAAPHQERAPKFVGRGRGASSRLLAPEYPLYGLIAAAMAYAAFDTGLQRTLLDALGKAVGTGPMQMVAGAYSGGHLFLATVLTFGRRCDLR